ncbi:HIT-like protein HI_0961 [Serratia fonticola]|uniref:HIT-like protein HI_0961 n=1 Tax=Serratia fonticola TaxID=47917 RepID=A0A4U9VUB9_SERFO|nr:HIT-like protein HI_0961 [Serratia fonticola]
MAEETIFSKIIRREIPADVVYQDELVTAFRDISPQAPTHILIVPNVLIPTVNDVTVEHEAALGRMITVAAKIAEQEGIAEDGYRLLINCNRSRRARGLSYSYAFSWWARSGPVVVTLTEEDHALYSHDALLDGAGAPRRDADGL